MGQINKRFLPIVLFILFNAYQVNILLFSHVHYINGIPITHSHPNKGEHNHPEDGIRFIALLSSIHSVSTNNIFNFTIDYQLISIFKFDNNFPLIQDSYLKLPSLRAPPYIGKA